jgi:predicted SprT family Zn-dependent metalloprotease
MELEKAADLIHYEMAKWSLLASGWNWKWDNAKRRFGMCAKRHRVISLSRPLVALNAEDQVLDVIRHEIAHALDSERGHGPKWKQMAIKVGAKPERCYGSDTLQPKRRYVGKCERCAKEFPRHRRRTGLYHIPCVEIAKNEGHPEPKKAASIRFDLSTDS